MVWHRLFIKDKYWHLVNLASYLVTISYHCKADRELLLLWFSLGEIAITKRNVRHSVGICKIISHLNEKI